MKKLLNRIETSSTSSGTNIVQLPNSTLLNNSCGSNNGGGNGSGVGGSSSSSAGNNNPDGQRNLLGKTISLKKIHSISVEETIAEGGFGIVYLAKASSVKYALKRVIVNNEVDLNVVTREIQIMTTLQHPNLLPCLDFTITSLGNSVTEALLLMPYYKSNLLALLNQRMSAKSHLSERDVLIILLDIIAAIARLHHCTTPIIHRDIKIENVLIDESSSSSSSSNSSINSSGGGNNSSGTESVVGPAAANLSSGRHVLCDFGSATAKVWDPNVHSIQTIQDDLEKYTTLAYRAPEMVDLYSNRGTLNTKTDIWALGVFTYKMCFYTTPFGDSILAIQSANLTFPSSSTYSHSLHALISYFLTPDSNTRPDIFQCGELVSQLLKIKNPIQNLNASPTPPTFDVLINNMATRKLNSGSDAVVINKQSGATVTPLETSVTPRQRPKGNTILQAPTNGSIFIVPPPKSPCKLVPDSSLSSAGTHSVTSSNSNSGNAPAGVGAGGTSTTSSSGDNELRLAATSHHRRNVSDSSAFEKAQQQQIRPNNSELSATSSEQAISSWNPFEADFAGNAAALVDVGVSNVVGVGSSELGPATSSNPVAGGGGDDDEDPFENAPFEFFKYQTMNPTQFDDDENTITASGAQSPVDLFGAAPFSNPFLQFSSVGNGVTGGGIGGGGGFGNSSNSIPGIPPPPSSSSSTSSSRGSKSSSSAGAGTGKAATALFTESVDSSFPVQLPPPQQQQQHQPTVMPPPPSQKRPAKMLGVTNLSFED